MKNPILYPTRTQLNTLLLWVNHGPEALIDSAWRETGRAQDVRRIRSVDALNGLITRLDMPGKFEQLLLEVRHRDIGELNRELKRELKRVCRFYGYISPGADGSTPWQVTPLAGSQLHILRCWADGHDMEQITFQVLRKETTVRRLMVSARERSGAVHNAHLMALAYRREWLPGAFETRSLLSQGPVTSPGMLLREGA